MPSHRGRALLQRVKVECSRVSAARSSVSLTSQSKRQRRQAAFAGSRDNRTECRCRLRRRNPAQRRPLPQVGSSPRVIPARHKDRRCARSPIPSDSRVIRRRRRRANSPAQTDDSESGRECRGSCQIRIVILTSSDSCDIFTTLKPSIRCAGSSNRGSFDCDHRKLPLLFASPNRPRARISAAGGMTLAVNFLQKQRKQRRTPMYSV